MTEALFTIAGLVIGATVVTVVITLRRRDTKQVAQELLDEAQRQKGEELAAIAEQLKTTFAALSRDALSTNTDDFLKLAKTRLEKQSAEGEQALEGKKKLIDARLDELGKKLATLNTAVQVAEKQRAESHGAIKTQLDKTTQATNQLHATTSQLREALANPQRRGQWGERMAEDILRLAGFVEGINYEKQMQLEDGARPDFTFSLPDNRHVHMDVKFPLANYLKVLDADNDSDREANTAQFLRDVRQRIKEITKRSYIDPGSGTLDYVLIFIPNEQIYGFVHEHDPALLDDALRSKVVLCAPMTLYAILAVIRQSVENFRLDQNTRRILDLLAGFQKEWGKYTESMDTMGKRLKSALTEYETLTGVRTRQLDRQLGRIEQLRDEEVPNPKPALPSLEE